MWIRPGSIFFIFFPVGMENCSVIGRKSSLIKVWTVGGLKGKEKRRKPKKKEVGSQENAVEKQLGCC